MIHGRRWPLALSGLAVAAIVLSVHACSSELPGAGGAEVAEARDRWLAAAGPVTDWPRTIPMRTEPAVDDGLLVTVLGDVEPPLANGVYDPVTDRAVLNDGTVIGSYFREVLDVPYYKPLDKSVFPLPPSGWCSWYYYYREVTPEEVLANSRWISANLLDHGAWFVQIDDGWQAFGGAVGSYRDWTGLDADFQEIGMDGLAREIRVPAGAGRRYGTSRARADLAGYPPPSGRGSERGV